MMNFISIVDKLNSFLWDNLLIFLLLGTGIYYSFRLRFPQVRKIKAINEHVFGKILKKVIRLMQME